MPNITISPWIANRILAFFNAARRVEDLLDGTIKDDPADNWFSWERIQAEADKYISYHAGGYPWEMELRFFRGVQQRGIIPVGITPTDLPVMVNWPERAITIWFSTLYD